MKKTSRIALVLLATTFLSAPALAEWTPENEDGSAYSITAGSADDYSFTTTDGENISYWKINLNPDNFSTQDSITWSTDDTDADGLIEVQLPNSEDPTTLYYTYTMPEGYTETNTRLTELTSNNVTSKVFKNIGSNTEGGAINLGNQDYNDINITSDFIGNHASYNSGAIHNSNSVIGNIIGNFIGNYIQTSRSVYGGTIYNFNSNIGDITGDFVGNYVQSSGEIHGGTIYNYYQVIIGNIAGNFIGNYAESSSERAYGGVIYNDKNSTIGNITGNFIGNYVYGKFSTAGGAIYNGANYNNDNSTIGDITGNFIGN